MKTKIDKGFSKTLRQAVKAVAQALEEEGKNAKGHCYGPNQFIFDEAGTVSDASGSLCFRYDLHTSDDTKAIVALALKDFENVRYETDARYRDIDGQWHVNEMAFTVYAKELMQQNTEIEHQKFLSRLLIPESSATRRAVRFH